jgi:hypothetical protein
MIKSLQLLVTHSVILQLLQQWLGGLVGSFHTLDLSPSCNGATVEPYAVDF